MTTTDKRYALLVGINYRGTSNSLRGCIEDVNSMRTYLLSRGYLAENITVLTDDTPQKPTGVNIMHGLATLILRAHTNAATEIWFHYSGHGSYIRDTSGDETDGRDETIVPLDFENNGMIDDDTLNEYASHVPKTCKLVCIMDCCHSGTVFDLKYRYDGLKNYTENAMSKINSNIFCISGCMDSQTSADTIIGGRWSGAMTQSFLNAMRQLGNDATCYSILDNMHKYLRTKGYDQIPQLSCTTQVVATMKLL